MLAIAPVVMIAVLMSSCGANRSDLSREIDHILISNSDVYDKSTKRIMTSRMRLSDGQCAVLLEYFVAVARLHQKYQDIMRSGQDDDLFSSNEGGNDGYARASSAILNMTAATQQALGGFDKQIVDDDFMRLMGMYRMLVDLLNSPSEVARANAITTCAILDVDDDEIHRVIVRLANESESAGRAERDLRFDVVAAMQFLRNRETRKSGD